MKTKEFNFEHVELGTKVLLDGKINGEIVHLTPVTAVMDDDYGKFAMCFDNGGLGMFWDQNGARCLDEFTPRLELVIEPKPSSDLSGIQQGTPVYDLAFGWGAIHKVKESLISASFGNYTKGFDLKGHPYENGTPSPNQTLFLAEIDFVIPEMP